MAVLRRRPKLSHLDESGRPRMVDISANMDMARLAQIFQRNGYIRAPRDERRRALGPRYKKGWEVRLVLKSQEELVDVHRLLEQSGLKAGRPFKKSRQWVQPIYSKKAVDFFTRWAAPHD